MAAWLRDAYPSAEFNIEGNPIAAPRDDGYPGLEALVVASRPAQVTLVPDGDGQLTSDHGWALTDDDLTTLEPLVARWALGARVSLFMDPNPHAIARVPETGADRIELYTEPFAGFQGRRTPLGGRHGGEPRHLSRGRGDRPGTGPWGERRPRLDLDNLVPLRTIPGLKEVSMAMPSSTVSFCLGSMAP